MGDRHHRLDALAILSMTGLCALWGLNLVNRPAPIAAPAAAVRPVAATGEPS